MFLINSKKCLIGFILFAVEISKLNENETL